MEGLKAELLVQLRVFLILRVNITGPLRGFGVGGRWERGINPPPSPGGRRLRSGGCGCFVEGEERLQEERKGKKRVRRQFSIRERRGQEEGEPGYCWRR